MQENKYIAVFGGSFNPPINSHIQLAKQILSSKLNVEKVIFVPVSTKYNKIGLESNLHRYNMLKIMCKNNPQINISTIEIDSNRQLYTIETLDYLKRKYNEYNIYFVLGTDNLKEFKNWKKPNEILTKYKLLVCSRNNDEIDQIIKADKFLTKYKDSLILFDNKQINLSSTLIRNKIKNNEDVSEFMPKEIFEYIEKNNLYRGEKND